MEQSDKPQIPTLKDSGKPKDNKAPTIPSLLKDPSKPQLKIKGLANGTMSLLDRVKQFKKKDLAFISAGLGVLFMAPLAEHFMMSPENGSNDNVFHEGSASRNFSDGFGSGKSPYEAGTGGLSPGSQIGAGSDVITPLNVRDPSALVMGPGQSQQQPVTAPPPKPEAPAKSASSDWKDALANAASQGASKAAKAAALPVPKIPLQGGLRGLGAVSGGGGGGGYQLSPINASNVPNKASSFNSPSPIAATGYKGVGTRGPGSGEAGNLDKLKAAAGNAANLMNRGTGGNAIDNTAAASAAIPTGGAGTDGSGAGGADAASKGGSQNGSTGGKSQGESLAFQLAKSRAEKEMDLEFKKREAGDMQLEMYKLRNKALETFTDKFVGAAADFAACKVFDPSKCQDAAAGAGFLSCTDATTKSNALIPASALGKCGASAGKDGGVTAQLCKCTSQPGGGTSLCGLDGYTVKFTGCVGTAAAPDGGAGTPNCTAGSPDLQDKKKCPNGIEVPKGPDDGSGRKDSKSRNREAEVKPATPKEPIGGDIATLCAKIANGKYTQSDEKKGIIATNSGQITDYKAATKASLSAALALRGDGAIPKDLPKDCAPDPIAKLNGTSISAILDASENTLKDQASGLPTLAKLPTAIQSDLSGENGVLKKHEAVDAAIKGPFKDDEDSMIALAAKVDKDKSQDDKTEWEKQRAVIIGLANGVANEAATISADIDRVGGNLNTIKNTLGGLHSTLKDVGGYDGKAAPGDTPADGTYLAQVQGFIKNAKAAAAKKTVSSDTVYVNKDDLKAFRDKVDASLGAGAGANGVQGSLDVETGRYKKQAQALYDALDVKTTNRVDRTEQLVVLAKQAVSGHPGSTVAKVTGDGGEMTTPTISYADYGTKTVSLLNTLKSTVAGADAKWADATNKAYDSADGKTPGYSQLSHDVVTTVNSNEPLDLEAGAVQAKNQGVLDAFTGAPAASSKQK